VVDDLYVASNSLGPWPAVPRRQGGRGTAPVLKKLVADVLDRVDQFADFDPRAHYALTVRPAELTDAERGARSGPVSAPDDIDLDMG
jgi:hypothetical protein